MKKFNNRMFFKVKGFLFCLSRREQTTSGNYITSFFVLYKIKDAERIFIANVGMEKSFHPNKKVSAEYTATIGLDSLEPNKLINEDDALTLAKEYAECLLQLCN
jgi:hypothetical protein